MQTGFFGRGSIDDFFRKTFNVSVQHAAFLLEDYACTANTREYCLSYLFNLLPTDLLVANRKLSVADMQAAISDLILTGLRKFFLLNLFW